MLSESLPSNIIAASSGRFDFLFATIHSAIERSNLPEVGVDPSPPGTYLLPDFLSSHFSDCRFLSRFRFWQFPRIRNAISSRLSVSYHTVGFSHAARATDSMAMAATAAP